jgi:hypothetical protein
MIRLFLIIATAAIPTFLHAETINVISGEHADFSRLVFQYPTQEDWTIYRFDNGYVLDTETDAFDYNTARVFNFIPKTRISKFENVADGTLRIFTPPGFHLDAFDLREGRLVVDIKDGLPSNDSKFEQPRLAGKTDRQQRQTSGSDDEIDSTINNSSILMGGGSTFDAIISERLIARDNGSIQFPSLPSRRSLSGHQSGTTEYFSPEIDPLGERSTRVQKMEEALFGQIGRAVSQGLLQADLPAKELAEEATNRLKSTHISTREPLPPNLPSSPKVSEATHVRVQTAVDRDLKQSKSSDVGLVSDAFCPPEDFLDIKNWGEPPLKGLLFSELRGQTLGEFDQPNNTGVEKLAKYYLYLSFGAEAKLILDEFGVFVPNSMALRVISDVMDNGYSDSYKILGEFSECSGAAGFWSAVARKEFNQHQTLSGPQIASYFSGLPVHLRTHLGPELSEKFISIGAVETAKLIQNAISRVEGDHGDAFDLLDVEMQLSEGNFDNVVENLDAIAKRDGPTAADALIRIIEVHSEKGKIIDPKTAELAEILTIEHRGTPMEGDLLKASITARILSKRPDLALDSLTLSSTQSLLTLEDRKRLTNAAAIEFTASFDDLSFAKEAMALVNSGKNLLLTDEANLQISERMLALGFEDLASYFTDFKSELSDRMRTVLGNIAKRAGNNAEALAYLLGIDGQETMTMRAELYLQLGFPEKAAEEFKQANQTSEADEARFLAENWEALANSKDAKTAVAAKYFSNEQEDTASESITISATQNLLSRSQSARMIFDDLVEQ